MCRSPSQVLYGRRSGIGLPTPHTYVLGPSGPEVRSDINTGLMTHLQEVVAPDSSVSRSRFEKAAWKCEMRFASLVIKEEKAIFAAQY